MSKILLHICCAPCAVYPVGLLQSEGHELMGFFSNPNIHPLQEYTKRREAVEQLEHDQDIRIIYEKDYQAQIFFREISYREERRCFYCYSLRLEQAARFARKGNFDAFSSTLLVSRYQKHDMIKELGEAIGEQYSIPFLYRDFREGFNEGRQTARERGYYMQKYCGCLYSENERYSSIFRR